MYKIFTTHKITLKEGHGEHWESNFKEDRLSYFVINI